MSNFSRVYRGWTLRQTDRGWIIVNAPNRDKAGPISPGPYGTYAIAEHVVDRIVDNSYDSQSRENNSDMSHLFPSVKDDLGPVTSTIEYYVRLILLFFIALLFFSPAIARLLS